MANLPMPPINFGGNPPDAITEIVTQATNGNNTPSGQPPVYSRNPLPMPAPDQLVTEPAVGYPF
jgi:hypothetical protein